MARVQGNNYPYSDVGNRLVQVRKDLGLSQTQFAERLGVHWQTISRMETGQRKVDAEVLVNLCEMGYDATWLLTGKGDMLLKERSEVEEQKLLAEYWQTNHRLIEMALKIAYQRVVDDLGQERADKIFKEVIPSPQVKVMFPHPAGKVHDAGAVAEEEKKQEKGKRSKS